MTAANFRASLPLHRDRYHVQPQQPVQLIGGDIVLVAVAEVDLHAAGCLELSLGDIHSLDMSIVCQPAIRKRGALGLGNANGNFPALDDFCRAQKLLLFGVGQFWRGTVAAFPFAGRLAALASRLAATSTGA